MYRPDGWVLVKITNKGDTYYKIFSSWRGGYLDGDSWRMNSGITKCELIDGFYEFSGHSGSVYCCSPHGYYRLGMYNLSVLTDYVERSEGKITILESIPENILEMDWEDG